MPANTPPTQDDLKDAGTDLETIDLFANGAADLNGDGTHVTRGGTSIKVLARLLAELQAEVDDAATATAGLESKSGEIADLTLALQVGGVLDTIHNSLPTLDTLTGYLAPVDYASAIGVDVTESRYTVLHNDGGGAQIWAIRPELLPYTVPAIFAPADWYLPKVADTALVAALTTRLDDLERQIARFNTIHPPAAPIIAPIPNQAVEEGFTGAVIDLTGFVSDADTPPENLTLSVSVLPAGLSFADGVITAAAPAISAQAPVTLTVEDESGQSVNRVFRLEVYAVGASPLAPPVWGILPDLTIIQSGQLSARDHKNDVTDADNSPEELVFSIVGDASHGVTVSPAGVRGGFAGAPGVHTVTVRATDPNGQFDEASYQLTVTPTNPPLWQTIPARMVAKGSATVSIDLADFVGDPVTPDQELRLTAVYTGLPAGAVVDGLVLSLPTAAAGVFRIGVTVTNRAGMSASKSFDYTVFELSQIGAGAGGGGKYGIF